MTFFRLQRAHVRIVALALLAFGLLTVRFSPDWLEFYRGVRPAMVSAENAHESRIVEKTILGGLGVNRGYYVTRQVEDLKAEADNPDHKIVRWRLLMPALDHLLGLPGWVVLTFAHLGCLALILVLVALGWRFSAEGRPPNEAMYFGVVAGATAPFFTSMGWLGYYDSWLALALIGVAFSRQRWVVVVACLLAPWIDERFVIGLPLALCVRRIQSDLTAKSAWSWFKSQAVVPLMLACGYVLVRLELGGSGGSQTLAEYVDQFVFSTSVPAAHRLHGAWFGLRVGWLLVAGAVLGGVIKSGATHRTEALVLAAGVAVTSLAGLYSALDMSRSMVLVLPVLPLGWGLWSRTAWWGKFHCAPILAALALCLPARHVVGENSNPVDNLWSPSLPLMCAQNNIGVMYARGAGVARDPVAAANWYRKSGELGHAAAQVNLGAVYSNGDGVPKDNHEAVKWFRKAAAQGEAVGQNNLGAMYANGEGVARDPVEAVKWFRKAAEQGNAPAQANLGWMHAIGSGTPKDLVQAHVWLSQSAAAGYEPAAKTLEHIAKDMTPEQLTHAIELRRKTSSTARLVQPALRPF